MVQRASGVRNKLLTSDQATYEPKTRGWESASLALYFLITQVRTAPTPSAAISGTGPAQAKGFEVNVVTTMRNPTSAPSGVSTNVNTVLGWSFQACCRRVFRVKKKSRTMLRRHRSCCLKSVDRLFGTVVQQ